MLVCPVVLAKATAADITAPTITSTNTASVAENTTLSKSLTADESVTWSITGGADALKFEISGSTLRWAGNGTKDFETPNDADTNNTYVVQVTATDGASNATNQTVTVTVTDVLDDAFFANVVFLAHFSGTDGATSYSEEKNGRAATFSGNAQLDTAQFWFTPSSLLLDGTGDQISFADNVDWDLANANSDPYCIEMWVRFNAIDSTHRGLIGQWGSAGNRSWGLEITSGALGDITFSFTADGSTVQTVASTGGGITTVTWTYLRIDHDAAGKIRLYKGVVGGGTAAMIGSATPANSTMFNSTATLTIGASLPVPGLLNGWVGAVRITKGADRGASDSGVPVPTAPFPTA